LINWTEKELRLGPKTNEATEQASPIYARAKYIGKA
jgi:hypothetical protein